MSNDAQNTSLAEISPGASSSSGVIASSPGLLGRMAEFIAPSPPSGSQKSSSSASSSSVPSASGSLAGTRGVPSGKAAGSSPLAEDLPDGATAAAAVGDPDHVAALLAGARDEVSFSGALRDALLVAASPDAPANLQQLAVDYIDP